MRYVSPGPDASQLTIFQQHYFGLQFGDVFNFWREKMGTCGMFEWNENLYLTLYKEESLIDCDINHEI